MPYQFTVSPDFTPGHLSGWHIFNTWLQKSLNEHIHLEIYDDFESQRQAILSDEVDLIYANPYDAAVLVREKGFRPVVKPGGKSDEAVVAVNTEHQAQNVEDLQSGVKVASTDDPDIHLMGMIMLEPADLDKDNIAHKTCNNYVLVAKALLKGDSDVGFFLAEAFNDLSGVVRKQLRPLVSSQIQVVHHVLLVGPRLAKKHGDIEKSLLAMGSDAKGAGVLESLGLEEWEPMEQESMEFMIDLMDTLGA
jgi:phosphonate transport system substrate-binding protein